MTDTQIRQLLESPLINRSAVFRIMNPGDDWHNMKNCMRYNTSSFNMRHVRNFRNDPDVMELLQLLETVFYEARTSDIHQEA